MPDYPPEALSAAKAAISKEMRMNPNAPGYGDLARAVLDAAAPVLAEAVAAKIAEHMEKRGPRKPRGPLEREVGIGPQYRAWRRHFGIAARIAAGAFDTREDQLRKAAEAIDWDDLDEQADSLIAAEVGRERVRAITAERARTEPEIQRLRDHIDIDHRVMVQLGIIADTAVKMLEHINMDTGEDRELHARAVGALRSQLNEMAATMKEANEGHDR